MRCRVAPLGIRAQSASKGLGLAVSAGGAYPVAMQTLRCVLARCCASQWRTWCDLARLHFVLLVGHPAGALAQAACMWREGSAFRRRAGACCKGCSGRKQRCVESAELDMRFGDGSHLAAAMHRRGVSELSVGMKGRTCVLRAWSLSQRLPPGTVAPAGAVCGFSTGTTAGRAYSKAIQEIAHPQPCMPGCPACCSVLQAMQTWVEGQRS